MVSTIETLSTEFSNINSTLRAAEIRKRNVNSLDCLRIAQEYSKYASSLLHLADFAAESTRTQPSQEPDLEEAMSADVDRKDIVDAVEASLEGVVQAVKSKLDSNMQSSLEIADILSAVLDLQSRAQTALEDSYKKMANAKTAIWNLNAGINSATVALAAAQKQWESLSDQALVTVDEAKSSNQAGLVAGSSGLVLWGAAIAFPALLVPSLVATGVQYWHLGKTYSKVNELKKFAAECEVFKLRISKAEREIAGHESLSTALAMEIDSMQTLLSGAETFVPHLEACVISSQTIERRCSEEQTLAVDLVKQTQQMRMAMLDLPSTNLEKGMIRALKTVAAELDVITLVEMDDPQCRGYVEEVQNAVSQLKIKVRKLERENFEYGGPRAIDLLLWLVLRLLWGMGAANILCVALKAGVPLRAIILTWGQACLIAFIFKSYLCDMEKYG